MDHWIAQAWQEIMARPDGPVAGRFYLQPAMATFFAIRDGLKDARNLRPAYMWSLFTERGRRREILADGWKSIRRVFFLAVALDLVYQWIVLHGFRPLETLFIASTLALIPYAIVRGPVNRIARRWVTRNDRGRRAA
jgi:hypothetical protein